MRCRVTTKNLLHYLNGLLSAHEADIFKAHIEKCRRCQGRLESFQKIDRMYRNIVRLETPSTADSGFERKLQERIEREEAGVSIPELVLVPVRRTGQFVREHAAAVATSAVALLILLSIGIYQIGGALPTVASTFGEVQIFDKRGRLVLAKAGMSLRGNEVIRTGSDGKIDINLRDRYITRLEPESELFMEKLIRHRKAGRTQFRLTRGEFLVNIKKKVKGSEFVVRTPTAKCVATGTEFTVESDDEKTKFYLVGGELTVFGCIGMVDLAGGQMTVVYRNSAPLPPVWMTVDDLDVRSRKLEKALGVKVNPEVERRVAVEAAKRAVKVKKIPEAVAPKVVKEPEIIEEEKFPLKLLRSLKEDLGAESLKKIEKSTYLLGNFTAPSDERAREEDFLKTVRATTEVPPGTVVLGITIKVKDDRKLVVVDPRVRVFVDSLSPTVAMVSAVAPDTTLARDTRMDMLNLSQRALNSVLPDTRHSDTEFPYQCIWWTGREICEDGNTWYASMEVGDTFGTTGDLVKTYQVDSIEVTEWSKSGDAVRGTLELTDTENGQAIMTLTPNRCFIDTGVAVYKREGPGSTNYGEYDPETDPVPSATEMSQDGTGASRTPLPDIHEGYYSIGDAP